MRKMTLVLAFVLVLSAQFLFAAVTGKIAGVITDSETGLPLPGVNVIVENTMLGAATDITGYYAILNVPPGMYTLKATMIGYAPMTATGARVLIDLTTTVNFRLQTEVIAGETVTIVAERPVVRQDIAASQTNLSVEEIEALPAVSVERVVGMEAGIRGLTIRGGGASQTAFVVNGFTMRDERDNQPYTAISYTAVDEIKIQTGGFSAEFGNIRSGLINVVTKQGQKDAYHFGLLTRYSPPSPKHFGLSPNDPESYWIRPYMDDEVCWTGTSAWPAYLQSQYPGFDGWNAVSEKTLLNDDPSDDLTPEAAQRLFLWQHRRELDIRKPDYDFDVSFGGPVPLIGKPLGDLRFFASYRRSQNMYIIPLSDDASRDYNAQIKFTSDIREGMKLTIEGMMGQVTGTNDNNSGNGGLFSGSWGIAEALSRGPKYIDCRIYCPDYWCPTTIKRNSVGAKFTHVINAATFYDVTLQRFESLYDTNPGPARDTSRVYLFGNNWYVDEGPFGFYGDPANGIGSGLRMGVGMSNSRDTSRVATYSLKFDFNSQINRFNHIKAGIELVVTDNDVNYGRYDKSLTGSNINSRWHTYPARGAIYAEDKLEFKLMIATLGLRLDYSHAGGEWYDYDTPYTDAFSAANYTTIDTLLEKSPTKRIFNLSPRLGVAFPITVNSKLFFNYGHFRQIPTPENLYLIRRYSGTKALSRLANPNNPLPKTIEYELGYEHNLFDQFLVRLAGYYKDSSLQSRLVTYENLKNTVSYSVTEPNSYQDTRGFELTIRKNRGNWIQGFVNYTYEVTTSGYFGFGTYYENSSQQRTYETETRSHYQEKPVPRPFARANIDLFTPVKFGPKVLGLYPLEDWRLNVLLDWRAGIWATWTGGGSIPGILYNVQWRDFWNLDLRFSKSFRFGKSDVEFFLDISNVLNYKYMASSIGFVDGEDYNSYMKSLHLPAKIGDELGYGNIPGEDRPGDFRDWSVAYQPIERLTAVNETVTGAGGVIYYVSDTERYMEYTGGQWMEVEAGRMDKILDEKAYIDMPNQTFLTFLGPRQYFWGLRISFDVFK